jgi:hypothetical protein
MATATAETTTQQSGEDVEEEEDGVAIKLDDNNDNDDDNNNNNDDDDDDDKDGGGEGADFPSSGGRGRFHSPSCSPIRRPWRQRAKTASAGNSGIWQWAAMMAA